MIGLSSAEAARLFAQYGPNEITEKKPNGFMKLVRALVSLIPADACIEHAVNLEINEAVLTGESMPKEKKPMTPRIPARSSSRGIWSLR